MKEKNVSILIGLGIGGIITFVMFIIFFFIVVFMHQRMQEQARGMQELIKRGQIVDVVVAKDDIPKETIITIDMIKISPVSLKTFQPGDLTSFDSVIGKETTREIFKYQHINADFIKIPEKIDSDSVNKKEETQ